MANNRAQIEITAQDRASLVLRQVRAEVDRMSPAVTKLRDFAAGLGLLGGGAVALSIGGVTAALRSMVSVLDDLDEAAQAAGTSAVALAELRQGAVQAGVGAETLDTALSKLNVKLADAAAGNEQAAALFKALGVSVTDASGNIRSADSVLADIADRFQGAADGANKSAFAIEIFGRAGAKLVPFLNQGSDGLRVFSGLTEETVQQAARLEAEFDKLKASAQAFRYEVAGGVIPELNKLIEASRKVAQESKDEGFADRLIGLFSGRTLKRVREAYTEVERLRDLARIEDRGFTPVSANRQSLPSIPQPVKKERKQAEEITDAQRALAQYVETLARESEKLEQITEQERVLQLLRANPSIDTPQVRELLFGLAERVEKEREVKELNEAQARAIKEQIAAEKALRDEVLELSGVAEQQRIEALLKQRDLLFEQGLLTEDQLAKATRGIFGLRDEIDKTKDVTDEFALVLQSAVGDLIVNGGSGSDFFKALLKDIEQVIVKMLILEPLLANIKKLLSESGIADAVGKFFSSLGTPSSSGTSGLTTGDFTRADRASSFSGGGSILGATGGGGGGAAVTVNVVNNAGAKVSTQQRRDSSGGLSLDVLIEQLESAIGSNIASGRSTVSRSIESRFGLRPVAR